jgi:hypothetical protein
MTKAIRSWRQSRRFRATVRELKALSPRERPYVAAVLLAALALLPAAPAFAVGEILITHSKALAGNVTPGDTAGYPVTISRPGTFQLASNLFVAANKIGIQVTSPYVTIDLNGFLMQGSNVAWYGVTGGVNGVTIENGTIASFKFDGIHGTGKFWIAENVRSVGNGRDGIVLGQFALIRSSVVVENGRKGLVANLSSVIQGNTVSNNGDEGIYAPASAVVGNAINFNGSYGMDGNGTAGYSGNTLVGNNGGGGGHEAAFATQAHPNYCYGYCP